MFPRSFVRQSLMWDLPGGEVAQCTYAIDNSGGGFLNLSPAFTGYIASTAAQFWTDIKEHYPSSVLYKGCRTQLITVNNTVSETVETAITGVPGTSTSRPLPTEVAVCVSLRTAVYGRRTRGRMFLPAPSTSVMATDSRLEAAVATDIVVAADTLLSSFSQGAATFFSVVASATGGLLTPVNRVAVGDVLDVQRRRRDELAEVYVSQPVT